jgi:hypothetical protein
MSKEKRSSQRFPAIDVEKTHSIWSDPKNHDAQATERSVRKQGRDFGKKKENKHGDTK